MNPTRAIVRWRKMFLAVPVAVLIAGCASDPSTSSPTPSTTTSAKPAKTGKQKAAKASTAVPLPSGVSLIQHPHLQAVWVADGFAFHGYDAALVETPAFKAVVRDNEVAEREAAIRALQDTLAGALRDSQAFASVATQPGQLAGNARSVRLESTIIEFEKGGGAARYFAGLYGGGQPVIKVRGHLVDATTGAPLFVFESRRSGESAGARLGGAFKSDIDIQAEDIRDLGVDVRDFISQHRTAAQ